MADSPDRCPTCGTRVPDGAPRCPGCGRVFGEANRCAHCHAVAAVIRRGNITVCAACGKPRAGATVLGGGTARAIMPASLAGRDASTKAMVQRGKARAQRVVGVLMLAMGLLMAAAVAGIVSSATGLVLAALVAVVAVSLGGLSMRAGAKNAERADDAERRARETAVLELASKRRGALTATELAKEFGVDVEEADATLTRMVGDGTRISVDVDDEGVVRYVFRELVPAASVARVRVEADEPEDEGPAVSERHERAARQAEQE